VTADYLGLGLRCALSFGCVGQGGFDYFEDKFEVEFGLFHADLVGDFSDGHGGNAPDL
jgi:hypothetical protein